MQLKNRTPFPPSSTLSLASQQRRVATFNAGASKFINLSSRPDLLQLTMMTHCQSCREIYCFKEEMMKIPGKGKDKLKLVHLFQGNTCFLYRSCKKWVNQTALSLGFFADAFTWYYVHQKSHCSNILFCCVKKGAAIKQSALSVEKWLNVMKSKQSTQSPMQMEISPYIPNHRVRGCNLSTPKSHPHDLTFLPQKHEPNFQKKLHSQKRPFSWSATLLGFR